MAAVTLSELVVKISVDTAKAMTALDAFSKRLATLNDKQARTTQKIADALNTANLKTADIQARQAVRINAINDRLSTTQVRTKSIGGNVSNAADKLWVFQKRVASITSAMYVLKNIAETGFRLEGIEAGLTSVLGSDPNNAGKDIKKMTDDQMQYAKEIANRNGKDLMETRDAWMRISAASAGKVSNDNLKAIFEGVSDMGTVLGMDKERIKMSYLAIQQMLSKGVVQSEELKRQLSEHMPGALQIFARSINKTDAEVIKMMKDGTLIASEVLPAFGRELSRTARAGGAYERKVAGARAATTRFTNKITEASEAVYRGGYVDAITNITNALATLTSELIPVAKWVGNFSDNLVKSFLRIINFVDEFSTSIGNTTGQLQPVKEFFMVLKQIFQDVFSDKNGNYALEKFILTLEELLIIFIAFKTGQFIMFVVTSLGAFLSMLPSVTTAVTLFRNGLLLLRAALWWTAQAFTPILLPIISVVAAFAAGYYGATLLMKGLGMLVDYLGGDSDKAWSWFIDRIEDAINAVYRLKDALTNNVITRFFSHDWSSNSKMGVQPKQSYMSNYVNQSSKNTPSGGNVFNNEVKVIVDSPLSIAGGKEVGKTVSNNLPLVLTAAGNQ